MPAAYHLIFNPAAGRGRAIRETAAVSAEVRRQLGDVAIYHTDRKGHAAEIAASLRGQGVTVIAAGGDGTVHEIVNGLVGGNCTLGIIPIGSGNDFVKMLNLKGGDWRSAVAAIRRGHTLQADVGKVGAVYFPNGVGIGFDAEALIESHKTKHLKGFALYFASVLKALRRYRNRTVTLTIDGRRQTREIFLIAVGNGECAGGGFYLTPGARIDDGRLDVCIARALKLREILLLLPRVVKGKHIGMPQVEYLQAEHLRIESAQGIPAHADGELLGADLRELEIELLPAALKVIHNLNPD